MSDSKDNKHSETNVKNETVDEALAALSRDMAAEMQKEEDIYLAQKWKEWRPWVIGGGILALLLIAGSSLDKNQTNPTPNPTPSNVAKPDIGPPLPSSTK